MNWYFGVLGPLSLTRDGEPVPLAGARPRAMLALLLARDGQPASVERLADELWDEQPPASVASALHVHLSKLRAVIGDLLVKTEGGYVLDVRRFETDAAQFKVLVDQARADPDRAAAGLREALALWRGQPLQDLGENVALDRWRAELSEARLRAQIMRIDADLAEGATGALVPELRRMVVEQPYEEHLWEQLMLALYRDGRQAEALDTYQQVRRRLDDELGLEPRTSLRALQEQILNHAPELTLAAATTAELAPAATAATQIPSVPPRQRVIAIPRPITRLVGREAELAELGALAEDPVCRLITILGDGGVGKTRLAIEFGLRWSKTAFADGAVFVSLAQLSAPEQVPLLIASTIARRSIGEEPSPAGLGSYLASKDMLLILDNFEHVLGASQLVAELLGEAPDIRVIATSRAPLRLRGEQRFDVAPLAVPAEGEAMGGPAVELFLQGAAAVKAQIPDDEETRAQVASICRGLDGLPLAIELASARTNSLSIAEIHAQLAEPLGVGANALVDMPDRQQTLSATIRWSYELLPEAARRTFRAAARFRGSFTAEALIAAAGPETAAALGELLEANVVKRAAIPERFRLLELVWAFAREVAADEPAEAAEISERMCQYYVQRYTAAAEVHGQDGDPANAARELMPERGNLIAAARHAIAWRDAPAARVLIFMLEAIWTVAGAQDEAAEMVGEALERCRFAPIDELWLLRIAAISWSWGPREVALLNRYAERAQELGEEYESLDARMMLLVAALANHDLAEAMTQRDAILASPEPPADRPRGRSARAFYLSQCAYVEGDIPAAVRLAEEMFEPVREGPHAHSRAIAYMWQVFVESASTGQIRLATLAEQVASARQVELIDLCVVALWNAARYAAALKPALARVWLADADRIAAENDFHAYPEDELRREALVMLGIDTTAALAPHSSRRGMSAVLDEVVTWLESRDRTESVPRQVELQPWPTVQRAR